MSATGSATTTSTRDGGFGRLDGYLLNAVPDQQDLRDYRYEPALIQLRSEILPPKKRTVLDQGSEAACTGFGLAAVINRLLAERGEARSVAARMLYEMAKKFDRWLGDRYEGSSCRAAVRGWQNMGVCSEKLAPYRAGERDWQISIERAKDARKTTLGAYYRVRKRLPDYHAALNEVGVIDASAHVHEGWTRYNVRNGEIPHKGRGTGGHAFAIVGYNSKGFYVQNSWGRRAGAMTGLRCGSTRTGLRTCATLGSCAWRCDTADLSSRSVGGAGGAVHPQADAGARSTGTSSTSTTASSTLPAATGVRLVQSGRPPGW